MALSEKKALAIKKLSNRKIQDKFSLHFMIQILNHKKYFYTYLEAFSRNEWLEKVIEEINTPEGWEKLIKLNTYKEFA